MLLLVVAANSSPGPNDSQLPAIEIGLLAFAVFATVFLYLHRKSRERNQRKRRLRSEAYFDLDVEREGFGPNATRGLSPEYAPRALSIDTFGPGMPAPSAAAGVSTAPSFGTAGPSAPSGMVTPRLGGGAPTVQPAGWYPDPAGTPNALRYWDGERWTTHIEQRG